MTPDMSMLVPFALLGFMISIFVLMIIITVGQAKQKKWGWLVVAIGTDAFALLMIIDCIGMMVTGSRFGWFRG